MRTYPQLSVVYPRTSLSIAGAVILAFVLLASGASMHVLSGMPTIAVAVPIALLVVIGLVARNVQAVVGTALVIAAGVFGTFAFTSARDAGLVLLVVAYTVALGAVYALYVTYAYIAEVLYERRMGRALRDHRYILSESVRKARDRILFASGVMYIGFLSMYLGPAGGIGRLGWLLAIATAMVTFASLTIVPAVIAWLPFQVLDFNRHNTWTGSLMNSVAGAAIRQPKRTLGITAGVAVASIVAALTGDAGPGASSMFYSLALAVGVVYVTFVVVYISKNFGTLAFIPAVMPVIAGAGIVRLTGHTLDAGFLLIGWIALAFGVVHSFHWWRAYLYHRKYFIDYSPKAAGVTLKELGRPVVLTAWVLVPAFGILIFAKERELVELGYTFCVIALTTIVVNLTVAPATLAILKWQLPEPRQSDVELARGFVKHRAREGKNTFDDYTDQEINGLFAGDFLALSGKDVIRQGGLYGTRRMLYELEIKPGMKILEIGTGVGASAFEVAEKYEGVQVVSVDLNDYMVSVAQERAKARGLDDRIKIQHITDPDHYPFEDGTFDIVMLEAIVMYANPDSIFSECHRLLKPGGRIGFHDWSWSHPPSEQFAQLTCVVACGCNLGDIVIKSKDDWNAYLEKWGFHPAFSEEFPFKFFTFTGLRDDEGAWAVVRMFARVMKRRATIQRMFRMMGFVAYHDGAYTFTISVGVKKPGAVKSVEQPDQASLPEAKPTGQPAAETNA